jgi:hypothetical protein
MSKLWTILLGLMLVTAAQAQTTDWKWNAELRTRYDNNMTQGFVKGALGANNAAVMGRTKIGTTMMRGDGLTGHVTLLHNNTWGDGTNSASLVNSATHNKATVGNLLLVQEAWGWWKSSDMLSLKFGRAGFEYGDGAIFAIDDWQANPNSWEGVWSQWTFDFADLHFFGTKLWDDVTPAAPVAGNDDPEVVAYGLVFNFKNLPEVLKHAFVHIVQINGDNTSTMTASTGGVGINRMHYGLTVMGDAGALDYRLTADMLSGKIKGAATDTTLGATMFDLELGWGLPEFMKARVALMAHMDGGDDTTTADKNEGYFPLYYDSHKFAGLMDVVGWGNSTYYGLGFSLNPSDDLNAGIEYLMFSRTSDKAAATNGTGGALGTAAGNTNKPIGTELDLHATKMYGENFSMWAMYGMFTPGEYIKNGGTADTYSKLQLQAKLTF